MATKGLAETKKYLAEIERQRHALGIYRSWDKGYFAYAIDAAKKVIIVRCMTLEDAVDEKERMKTDPTVRKVGYTTRLVEELTVRKSMLDSGYKVTLIRERN